MERSPRKARPKTMFALPGAGMGNDMLAEIKLKKLAKKTVRKNDLLNFDLAHRTNVTHIRTKISVSTCALCQSMRFCKTRSRVSVLMWGKVSPVSQVEMRLFFSWQLCITIFYSSNLAQLLALLKFHQKLRIFKNSSNF